MAPLIGITTREVSVDPTDPPTIGVRNLYVAAVAACEGLPVLIPIGLDEAALGTLLSRIDGLLFPGGEDIDPARYGEVPHPKLGKVSSVRDDTELFLMKEAHSRDLPTLGICRGLQVMNVALGGTLYQDIPSECNLGSAHYDHSLEDPWGALVHKAEITPASRLRAILGAPQLSVNSLHHQAAKKVPPPLKVSATSSDGVVEGLEDPSLRFFLSVQCHPEALWERVAPEWKKVFQAFVAAAAITA